MLGFLALVWICLICFLCLILLSGCHELLFWFVWFWFDYWRFVYGGFWFALRLLVGYLFLFIRYSLYLFERVFVNLVLLDVLLFWFCLCLCLICLLGLLVFMCCFVSVFVVLLVYLSVIRFAWFVGLLLRFCRFWFVFWCFDSVKCLFVYLFVSVSFVLGLCLLADLL